MAGDWFPVRDDIFRDLTVIKMARQLSQIRAEKLSALCPQNVRNNSAKCPQSVRIGSNDSPAEVPRMSPDLAEYVRSLSTFDRCLSEIVGTLVRLWAFADEQTEDGLLQEIDPDDLPVVVGGERDAWGCIIHGGWLVHTANGLQIPNYDKWLSNSAKRRARDRDRKKHDRQRPQNVRKTSESFPQNFRDDTENKRTTEQNRREENRRVNTHPLNPPQGEFVRVGNSAFGKCHGLPKDPPGFDGRAIAVIQQCDQIRKEHIPEAADLRATANLRKLVDDRLADGFSADDIATVFRWVLSSDHPRAAHLRGQGNATLHQILSVGTKGPYLDEYLDAARSAVTSPAAKAYLE